MELVAGRYRLEAVKSLEWENIDAIFIDGDEIIRELVEISENLHRADLTKEQRDEHLRRYAELLEEQAQKVVPQNAAKPKSGPKGGRPKSIAKKIAEGTGRSDDTVRRALTKSRLNRRPILGPRNSPRAGNSTASSCVLGMRRELRLDTAFGSHIDTPSRVIDFPAPAFLVRPQPPTKDRGGSS